MAKTLPKFKAPVLQLVPRTTADSQDTNYLFRALAVQAGAGDIVGAAVISLDRGGHYRLFLGGDVKRRPIFTSGAAAVLCDHLVRLQKDGASG
jgi:hypothetical protein